MNVLLDELNEFIGGRKRKPGKKRPYVPRKEKMDKIGSFSGIDFIIYNYVNDLIERKRWKNQELFTAFTGIEFDKIADMTPQTKEAIKNKTEEAMNKIKPSGDVLYSYLFNEKTKPHKDRVKVITEGKRVEEYYWITKEEEEKIFSFYKNIALLSLTHSLGENHENFEEEILKLILQIADRKECKKRIFRYFFTETSYHDLFNIHKLEKLKSMTHEWYQSSDKTLFQDKNLLITSIYSTEERLFLLNTEEIGKIQQHFLEKYHEQFERIKKLDRETTNKAKSIRENVIRVLEWGI